MGANTVVVEGVAVEITAADQTRSLPELIFTCVSAALADAGCRLRDVDAVTLSAEDLIDGRSLTSMITGPAAGAYLRDEIRMSEDGLSAVALGVAQLQSHTFDRVLVAAWGRSSEGDPERASMASFDPFASQPFGLTELTLSALRASAYLRAHGPQDAAREAAARARQQRARRNPRAATSAVRTRSAPYPLRAAELRTEADVVAAVVLRLGQPEEGIDRAHVVGVGMATEARDPGQRSLAQRAGVGSAVQAALAESGHGLSQIGLVELGGRTLWDEVQLLEGAGLAAPGHGLAALADDARFNPSGGGAAGDCEPATGLVRFVEAVQQLTGRAGGNQLPEIPRVALVAAGAGPGSQSHNAVVLEAAEVSA